MWSRAWKSRLGSPSRLTQVGARGRRSRAGRGRRTCRRRRRGATRVCRVSPYVAMAAMRTVPCSSVTFSGSREDGRAGRAGLRDALVDVGHLEGDVDDAVAVRGVVRDQRAVGADGAVDRRTGSSRTSARTTCGRGCRSRGRSRRRAPCPRRSRSSARSGWRCRRRRRSRPSRSPGTGRASSSYSTRPTSCCSCSRVRSAFISSMVRAPPVEAISVVMAPTMPNWRQCVQQYDETTGQFVH